MQIRVSFIDRVCVLTIHKSTICGQKREEIEICIHRKKDIRDFFMYYKDKS